VAIRVAAGTTDLICDYADGFVVEVTDASDVDAAAAALARARTDIGALARLRVGDPEGPVLSHPVLGPNGPMLRVARLEVSDDALVTIPDLVAARLEEAGLVDATIRAPEPGGALDRLDGCSNAVVLRLFPPPLGEGGSLPAEWIDIAGEWVLGDLRPSDTVPLRLLAVEFEVKVADAPSILHQASAARAWCDVVNGNLEERIRTASITFGKAPHVALAAGGPACDSQALLARFELLGEVAREYAGGVSYACLDIETDFDGIGLGLPNTGWRDRGGASPNLVAGQLSDLLVPDAYPYQILGEGHLSRMGFDSLDDGEPPFGEPVDDGKVELLIGEPAAWLPSGDARQAVLEQGWELLAPLLASDQQVTELLNERPQPTKVGEPDGEQPAPVEIPVGGLPDLDDITLETLPHGRRGLRLTLLELAAWLAHEPHSDAPVSVSPVLGTYARWFASAIDDRQRQGLKDRARRLVGTASEIAPRISTGPPHLSPDDVARAWLATDWLVRVQAASWLKLAGLTEAAARLESIGPTRNHVDLVRAVDVLGSAITITSRRSDLTVSIAGAERADDTHLVDQAAWDAWEQASEAGGWVAASEAASVGVPAELAYATDLRVIECARDAHVRDELKARRHSIGDTAWATALHAIADAAWTAGWDNAHPAVDALAVLPLKTATDRAMRAALSRAGTDDDAREMSLDAAESAAKESLATTDLGTDAWSSGVHPWDAAYEAAATAPKGALWASVQEMTRAAVEEGPWSAGMQAAREAVAEVLRDAPDLVARTVAAAVAREASGTAARGVALRAAAVARAQGASAEETTAAAAAALAPTVVELQGAAFELLDALVNINGDARAPLKLPRWP